MQSHRFRRTFCCNLVWLRLALITIKGKSVTSVIHNCLLSRRSMGTLRDCANHPFANTAWQINPIKIQDSTQSLKIWEITWARTTRGSPPSVRNNLWSATKQPRDRRSSLSYGESHLPAGDIVSLFHQVTRKKSDTELCSDRNKQIKDL